MRQGGARLKCRRDDKESEGQRRWQGERGERSERGRGGKVARRGATRRGEQGGKGQEGEQDLTIKLASARGRVVSGGTTSSSSRTKPRLGPSCKSKRTVSSGCKTALLTV